MPDPLPLPRLSASPEAAMYSFGYGWRDTLDLWAFLLAVALREGASLHYTPGQPRADLWWLIDKGVHELIPPPRGHARRMALAAGALSGPAGAAPRRLFGWPLRAGGRLLVDAESGPAEFAGAVWEAGGLVGVEWHRLDVGEIVELETVGRVGWRRA